MEMMKGCLPSSVASCILGQHRKPKMLVLYQGFFLSLTYENQNFEEQLAVSKSGEGGEEHLLWRQIPVGRFGKERNQEGH